MNFMIKDSDGKKDPILTMSVIALTVVLVKVLLNGFVLNINGTTTVTFGSLDGTVIGALLTPLLGAVVAHRYTDKKFAVDSNNNGVIDPEEKVE